MMTLDNPTKKTADDIAKSCIENADSISYVMQIRHDELRSSTLTEFAEIVMLITDIKVTANVNRQRKRYIMFGDEASNVGSLKLMGTASQKHDSQNWSPKTGWVGYAMLPTCQFFLNLCNYELCDLSDEMYAKLSRYEMHGHVK